MIQQPIQQSIQQPMYDSASEYSVRRNRLQYHGNEMQGHKRRTFVKRRHRGGGKVDGKVEYTTAVGCEVTTGYSKYDDIKTGHTAYAGIGGGLVGKEGNVSYTTAVESEVIAMGEHSNAGIGSGLGERDFYTTAVNSKVNGKPQNYYPSDSSYHLRCQKADPRVLTANCSIRTEFQDSGFSYNDACPVHVTIASTEATASTAPTTPTTEPTLADTRVTTGATVSTDATASTAATAAGITTGSLLAAGGLVIVGYSTYEWITGYRDGLRGQELAMKPLTRGKELASAVVNSVSQCIQGTRERMNRQRVPAQEPAHEMSQVVTDRVTELDKRL